MRKYAGRGGSPRPSALVDIRLKTAGDGAERFVRAVHAPDGSVWEVYEMVDRWDTETKLLVFNCQSVVRRIRDFPPCWAMLTDTGVLALMDRR